MQEFGLDRGDLAVGEAQRRPEVDEPVVLGIVDAAVRDGAPQRGPELCEAEGTCLRG